MAEQVGKVPVKSAQMSAVVRRADGTVENLGVIAEYQSNPFKRLWGRIQGKGRIRAVPGSKE